MNLLRTVPFAIALVFAGAIAHADTTPAKTDVDRWLAFFDKVVDTVVTDKDDCAKMATDVNKVIDDNKALLEDAKKAIAAGQKLPPEARQHMIDSSKRRGAAIQKCKNDKAVQAAIERLPKGPQAHK